MKHVLAPVCPPKPKWKHTMFLICHSEVGALRVSVAEDFHLVIAKLTRKRRRLKRYRLSLWTMGSSGNRKTEHTTHFQCSSCEIVKQRHLESPGAVEGCDAPVSCKGSGGRSGLHGVQEGESSSSQIRSPASLPSVTLSRMIGTTRLCLKHLPRARARATERSNMLFNPCTDLRGPSIISWCNNLESRWGLEVRCWPGWSSIVPIFSYSSTRVSHTTVTQPTCA